MRTREMKMLYGAAILYAALSSPVQADFDAALYAYSMGNYETAFREFKGCSDRGEAQGDYYLGLLHEEGQGVDKNYQQAFAWYSKAAEKHDVDAAFALGRLYASGLGVQKDSVRAYVWYDRAARGGHYLGKQERDKCANRMPADLLATARRLAAE